MSGWFEWFTIRDINQFWLAVESSATLTAYRYHQSYFLVLAFWFGCTCQMATIMYLSKWRMPWKGKRWTAMAVMIGFTSFVVPFAVNMRIEKTIISSGYQYCASLRPRVRFGHVVLYSKTNEACEAYRGKYCTYVGSVKVSCDFKPSVIRGGDSAG